MREGQIIKHQDIKAVGITPAYAGRTHSEPFNIDSVWITPLMREGRWHDW